jgi:hypothetical protein
MKVKNKDIYSTNQAWLDTIADEYESAGFSVVRGQGKLTVLVLKPKKEKPKRDDKKGQKREPKRAGARMDDRAKD